MYAPCSRDDLHVVTSLVHPIANLITTEQVRTGDLIQVDFDQPSGEMSFERAEQDLPVYTMFRAAGIEMPDDYDGLAPAAIDRLRRESVLTGIQD